MNPFPVSVCMISCLHGLYDDRIYWKEALSLKKHGYNVAHIGISDVEYDKISEHGIRLISIKRTRYSSNPYLNFLYKKITFKENLYKKILRSAAALQSEIYHFHDYQINRIGKQLKELPHKPKVIYDVHEPYPEIERYLNRSKGLAKLFHIIYSTYIDRLQRTCSRKYDAIVATEENVAAYFQSFLGNKKVKIIYNYCDLVVPQSVEEVQKEYDLIYIGGISQWRGIYELLNTAIEARKSNHNLKILFIGQIKEAGLKDKVSEIIRSENLHENFILKEFVPRNELTEYLKRSKIGVCIFKNNPVYHIILPIKIFEYMAFGLPVLANNFGHAYEIIKKEKVGIAVENITPDNILNAALSLLNIKSGYEEMVKNTKISISKYSWPNMEIKLLELYSELSNGC